MRKSKPRQITLSCYIGIDMSITAPGLCWNVHEDPSTCEIITAPLADKFHHRITRFDVITRNVMSAFPMAAHSRPQEVLVVIEDYAFGAGGRTFEIAECCGILKYKMMFSRKIPHDQILLCSTTHLKMFVSGKGNCSKDTVIKEVYKRWGFDTNNNNEADAYVLWRVARGLAGVDKLTNHQKEIIGRIRKYNR